MKDLGIGFRGFSQAFGFALRNGMGWLFLAPIVLWLMFAGGIAWVSAWVVDVVGAWVGDIWQVEPPTTEHAGLAGLWDRTKGFLDAARDTIVLVAVKLGLWFLFGLVGKYLVLMLLSPLLAYASERTEEILTGRVFPFRFGQLLKDAGRGLLMALRNGGYELLITAAIWGCTLFVAVLAPVSAVVLWLVSSWFYGFSMFDYIFERQRMNVGASSKAARDRRGVVLANGILFNLLMNLPLLGFLGALGWLVSAACFCVVPMLASIGAVLAWHEAQGNGDAGSGAARALPAQPSA